MARESEMIRNGGGLIDVTLCDGFLYCASVFSKSIAETTFSFPTSKKVYVITSPALLLTSCTWYNAPNAGGETKRRLCDRFGEHRRAVEKAITQRDIDQPTTVSDHFTLPGHSLNNLQLIPLELLNSNRDAIRKAREAFLIYNGKTVEPSGMNRRDEI